MSALNYSTPRTLAIALGANLPSTFGSPKLTLIKIRPLLEDEICQWIKSTYSLNDDLNSIKNNLDWYWSPLYETEPIGEAGNQPDFINAVLLVEGKKLLRQVPSEKAALDLLNKFLAIEEKFGRDRKNSLKKWGPRTLDIDFLAWGSLQINNKNLTLPHPRLIERNFVITPLAAALSKKGSRIKQLPDQQGWGI